MTEKFLKIYDLVIMLIVLFFIAYHGIVFEIRGETKNFQWLVVLLLMYIVLKMGELK